MERETAPFGANSRSFPERQGGNEIDLAAIARDHSKVEDARTRMGRSKAQFAVLFGDRFEVNRY
jgi:hypothetical protein